MLNAGRLARRRLVAFAIGAFFTIPACALESSITLYEHYEYEGALFHASGAVADLRSVGFNDRTSSIRLSNVSDHLSGHWEVCEEINFGGDCRIIDSNEMAVVPGNDTISSLRPKGNHNLSGYGRRLCQHAECSVYGWSMSYSAYVPITDMRYTGDGPINKNDQLTAVYMRHPLENILISKGIKFGYPCKLIDGDVSDLSVIGWNDTTSSVMSVD